MQGEINEIEDNMDVLKDSHEAEIDRLKKDQKLDDSVCAQKLKRCEKTQSDDKKECLKQFNDLKAKCKKDAREEDRHHKKEIKKLTEQGKELGVILNETNETVEYYKKQSKDYKEELQKCRDEN